MIVIVAYAFYVGLSIALTVWVANTLHKNGRAFLVDAFKSNEVLADSINHLLVVGFYLINLGYMSWVLKMNQHPQDIAMAIEMLSAKFGLVLMTLGVMHFGNVYIFARIRRGAFLESFLPPVTPSTVLK